VFYLFVIVLRLLVVGVGAAGCLALSGASAADVSGNLCPMSHVHYAPFSGEPSDLRPLPWISTVPGGKFKAYLFFYPNTSWGKQHLLGARIFTIRKPRNINPKVLWSTRASGYKLTLQMTGLRLDAPGSFSKLYKGFGDYPSYVEVPRPGCWRVTVTTGRVSGSVVFSASD
jgi:hypothetical protein